MVRPKPDFSEVFPLANAEPIGEVSSFDDVVSLFRELVERLYESEAKLISGGDANPDDLRRTFLKQINLIIQALSCVGVTETVTMSRMLAEMEGLSRGVDSRILVTENAANELKLTPNKRAAVTAEIKKKIPVATSLVLQNLSMPSTEARTKVGKVVEVSRHTIQNWENLYASDKEIASKVEDAVAAAKQNNTPHDEILERLRSTLARLL
jgi:hypothetical protein